MPDITASEAILDLPVDAVVYREDLYPRSLTDHHAVQTYAENLDVLPPIEVNQHAILIDGWHRWMAHKKEERATVRARVTETRSDVHILELAVERNAAHGVQLSREDKQRYARERYRGTPVKERPAVKAHLQKVLSVSQSTLYNWLERADKDAIKAQREQCYAIWLSCHTQEEIAEHVGVTQQTTSNWITSFTNTSSSGKNGKSLYDPALASHAVDFDIPQTNVWTEKDDTPHADFPGSTEPKWFDRLVYLYTQPFDIVVDPFAGSGSTIDVCKKRARRYFVSDRKPLVERAHEIRLHDVTEGLPPLHNWRDVRLVYLDPPYWKQREGDYSQDPTDLGNMTLEAFTACLATLVRDFGKKLPSGASIALIIVPTHWHSPEHAYTDHILDLVARVPLPVTMRIACPTGPSRWNAYLDWALSTRHLLARNREIVVWTVP